MTPFELVEPKTLKEAIGLLDADDPTVRPIAGGTALMLIMKAGVFRPSKLVSLGAIKELTSIATVSGELKVGATTPLAVLERSDVVRKDAPVITKTLRTLSNIRVRNVATVGGALAHGDPHMDLPPVLIALGARVNVVGKSGERTIAVADLFAGYYETTLAKDELIASLVAGTGRPPRDLSEGDDAGGARLAGARGCGVGGGRRQRHQGCEDRAQCGDRNAGPARGRRSGGQGAADDAAFRRAGEAAAEEAELITDAQGSAAYKKELVRVYVARALRAALGAT